MSILSHSMSHTTSPNTSSHSYLPSEDTPITVQTGHSTNGKIVKESFFIEEEDSSDSPSRVSKQLINQIQLLDYKKPTILDEFKATLKQHITFRQVIPQMISKVGQKLIQDGLFHQMWRKANSKDSCYFQNYYQHFISKITANHSCFQNTFNQYHSEDEFACKKQAQQDSNTRLTSKRYNKLKSQVLQSSLLQSSKENEQIHYSIESPSDRLRLIDEIQTNKRRLNAEMVCYFLGIKKFYRLTEMEIVSVLQFYHSQNKEVLILQAHEPTFCKAVDKIAIDYHPKIYIAMYGFISLTMLLRIKRQYSPIEGFILQGTAEPASLAQEQRNHSINKLMIQQTILLLIRCITINTFIFNAKDKQSTNSQMQENNFPTFQQVEVIYQMIKKKQSMNQSVRNKPIEALDIEMQQTSDYLSEIVNEKQYNQGEDFQDFQYDTQDFNDDQFGQDGDNYSQQQNGLSMKQRQKRKQKDRKVRTTITMQRLQQMNRIFKEYQEDKDKGRNPTTNLKEIGNKLKLGYSTILHKFRQFRQNKIVKGGALLESLQKKRKYNKSKDVEKCIEKSLRERPFYTAVQLSKYIFRRFNKSYSRSIISRHLTQMGYSFNNTKPFPLQKNSIKYIEARKMFVKIIQSYVQEDTDFLFIDQVAFSKNLFSRYFTNFHNLNEENKSQQQSDYISLLISANSHKIFYYQITTGFFEKQDFVSAIRQTKKIIDLQKKYSMGTLKAHVLLTDIHRIHHDHQCTKASEGSISKTLRELRLRRFFLPPGSPQLNPLESLFSTIRERLSKEGISSQEMLKKKLVQHMGTIYKQPTNVYFKQFKIWMDKAKFGQNF